MNSTLYRFSLGLTVLLTVVAFITLLGWLGSLVNGLGSQPWYSLIPWLPVGLAALAGINCTVRVRFILRRGQAA